MSNTNLTPDEHLKYLSLSLEFFNIKISKQKLDIILKSSELVSKRKKLTSILDLSKLQADLEEKYQCNLRNIAITLDKIPGTLDARLKNALQHYYKKDVTEIKVTEIISTSVADFSQSKNVGYQTLKKFESLKNFISNEY